MKNYLLRKYEKAKNATISELIAGESILSGLDSAALLDFDGDTGEKNIDRIWAAYSQEEKSQYQTQKDSGQLPYIKPNTVFIIPKDNIDTEKALLLGSNQILSQSSFESFLPEYKALLESNGYRRSQTVSLQTANFTLTEINNNFRVWIWIRAIDKVVDVSPFVRTLSTNKTEDVGSFSFTISNINNIDYIEKIGKDILDIQNVRDKNGHIKGFFDVNLQQNDVVFIRFERLEQEDGDDRDRESLEIPLGRLNNPQRVWDMIGLIDNHSVSFNAQSTSTEISVGGRDLVKLLIEDGSYFLPYLYIEGKDDESKFVYGGNKDNSLFKRNVISGAYDYFFALAAKPISDALGFIMNHLSNIGVAPNELFSSWQNKTLVYTVTGAEKYLEEKEVNGVWQIVKLLVDEPTQNRVFSGDSLMNPDGSLLDFFKQVCQAPFVEFFGDTYGNEYHYIVRQPPFSSSQVREVLNNGYFIEIEEYDLLSYNLSYDTRSYSSYEIDPQNNFFGAEDGLFKSIVPAIYLPNFADVFGNKRMSVTDPYIHLASLYGTKSNLDSSKFIEGVLNDYRYLIESNSYLPFTRQGSLTINGDRRIKRGSFVLNRATNELFYVRGVSHNAVSGDDIVNRETTVSVERGMVVDFINPRILLSEGLTPFSYFNIVDTSLFIKNVKRSIGSNGTRKEKKFVTNYEINSENFNFFLSRRQHKWNSGKELGSLNQVYRSVTAI